MEDLVLAMNPENPGWDFRSLNSVREQPVFVLFETFLAQNYSGVGGRGEKKGKKIKYSIIVLFEAISVLEEQDK